jgi:subtilisin family serine protease
VASHSGKCCRSSHWQEFYAIYRNKKTSDKVVKFSALLVSFHLILSSQKSRHMRNVKREKTRLAVLAFASIVLFASCKKGIEEQAALDEQRAGQPVEQDFGIAAGEHRVVPNELIVKFKSAASPQGRGRALGKVNGAVSETILTKSMQRFGDNEGITVIHTPLDVFEAVRLLKGDEDVVYAEPNYIYTHDEVSNDPYFTGGNLWGMGNSTYGSRAATAWSNGHTGSATVVVGVIDEGIQYNHPDLDGQVWTNPYDPTDGIDNDGNGYVDDIHGWDFDGNNNTIYDGGSKGSLDDHGTHVSGTIGGKGGNGIGVAGVNWQVTIISAKFLGRRGGTTTGAIKAVDYLTDLKTRHGINLVASNNSWGGGGYSQALYDAIERANNKDILFVAAAGNGGSDGVGDNNDVTANYPSNYTNSNVIAVAAITSSGARASFSNYGATTVDLGAPGAGIYSTTAFNTYSSYNGTSMATPHVTGAVALYASRNTGVSAATIKSAILTSVTPGTSGGVLNVSGF